ncbi:hypothetical protein [Mycobacterium vicinigordonae]|uniref:Tetratricopeptide repeat family protein n=1 Tax=Mycobacterium vicinigordonae TaxID=1719132 RepID=A0A7D6HPZ1_9MYCO|nr:hypothetical protein [Mycobacterium vicinigordonae]QLL07231.1 hypothetical protein H0P51_26815 [Mycobacterium vicinigordonae]
MSIRDELERARHLACAGDENSARDLLLSLMPRIEQEDRDDLLLEVFAQLGEIYLVRGTNDGVRECIRRIQEPLAIYREILAGTRPDAAALVHMSDSAIAHMVLRYSRRARLLQIGLAATLGDHDSAAATLAELDDSDYSDVDLADEHHQLLFQARTLCAIALCDDDLHPRSVPLWEQVLDTLQAGRGGSEYAQHLWVLAATAYGRFCVETGRLADAEPWLRRAGARAQANGWELDSARAQLERAAVSWTLGEQAATERLVSEAYPVIARSARAHEVSRCWLYLGLTRFAHGALQAADECWEHAERHWRELGKPLHLHRILLQRSWISIFRGRFAAAVELIAQARELLDSSPRSSWLQYALLDNHLGTVWRADALADLGFDGSGNPGETLRETAVRQAAALGLLHGETGTAEHRRAMAKLERAANLKVPAALAVDSVRYSIAHPNARSSWAQRISAPVLAGAFAVAWEWENIELVAELIEYHSARGTLTDQPHPVATAEWESTAAAPAFADTADESGAAATALPDTGPLTRLGPLPPLQMQPGAAPILSSYRALAQQRYGRQVTAAEPAWCSWP